MLSIIMQPHHSTPNFFIAYDKPHRISMKFVEQVQIPVYRGHIPVHMRERNGGVISFE